MSNNEYLVLDEPSERSKRTMDLVLPDGKRSTLATHLNQLADLTLGNIAGRLNMEDVMRLTLTGNWLLTAKITSQLKSLAFTRQVLSRRKHKKVLGSVWGWPDLLTQPLPHLTQLSVEYAVVSTVTVRFDLLPPSLTKLTLAHCVILVEMAPHVIFTLPLLHDLSISAVSANQMEHNLQLAMNDDQWLIPSIANSPLLNRVVYHIARQATFHSLKTIASLPNLTSLGIDHFLIDEAVWPPHLNSLQIFSKGEVVSIPSTITRLQLPQDVPYRLILAMTPETLLHLEMNITTAHWEDALIQLICQFSNLQTLNLILPHDFNRAWLRERDLSSLPRTINSISFPFALRPSQWRHLPPNVKFTSHPTIRRFRDMPCYDAVQNAADLPYFPKNLRQVAMLNCLLPMAMPHLTRVHFEMTSVDLPTTHASLLDNLPSTLTTLTISNITSLISFNDVDMAKRFPHLYSLWIDVALINDQDAIAPWLNALPRTLGILGLTVVECVEAENGRVPQIDLCQIVFPPRLHSLGLNIGNVCLALPETLPETLYSIELRGMNIALYKHIEHWPLGLRHLTVACTSSHADVRRNGKINTDASVAVLLQRIKDKFGQTIILNDAHSFKYQ